MKCKTTYVSWLGFVILTVSLSIIACYPLSFVSSFRLDTITIRVARSAAFLLFAAIGNFAYMYVKRKILFKVDMLFACCMMITASIIYSLTRRQYYILLVLPSLFTLPGAVLGSYIYAIINQKHDSE